jgi:hypothetical protein
MRNLSLGLGLRGGKSELDRILQSIRSDPAVQIAGIHGSMSLANPGCTFLDPATGEAISANRAYNLVGLSGAVLPMYTAFPAATNLFLNSTAPATQDVNVTTAGAVVTAIGTGYTVTTSAGTATGSGFGLVTNGTAQVLTITGNGSITLTIAGTPANACVQVQAGALRTPLIVTAGASVTRAVDANIWTMPDALTQDEEIIVLSAQCYASGDMGVATQTWLRGAVATGYPRLERSDATNDLATAYNGSAIADVYARTTPSVGAIAMRRIRIRTDGVEGGFNQSLSGSPNAGNTWTHDAGVYVGHSITANRSSFALNACIRRKGGFSQAQIDALYYAFANGRAVPVLA